MFPLNKNIQPAANFSYASDRFKWLLRQCLYYRVPTGQGGYRTRHLILVVHHVYSAPAAGGRKSSWQGTANAMLLLGLQSDRLSKHWPSCGKHKSGDSDSPYLPEIKEGQLDPGTMCLCATQWTLCHGTVWHAKLSLAGLLGGWSIFSLPILPISFFSHKKKVP